MMSNMFSGCSELKELNLSNFNTDNVTMMSNMFGGCSALKELKITNFNISNVNYIGRIFIGCSDDLKNKIRLKFKDI